MENYWQDSIVVHSKLETCSRRSCRCPEHLNGTLHPRKMYHVFYRENDDTDSRADLSDAAIREWCGKSGVVCPPGPLLVVPAEDDAGMDNTQGNGSPLHLPRRQGMSVDEYFTDRGVFYVPNMIANRCWQLSYTTALLSSSPT